MFSSHGLSSDLYSISHRFPSNPSSEAEERPYRWDPWHRPSHVSNRHLLRTELVLHMLACMYIYHIPTWCLWLWAIMDWELFPGLKQEHLSSPDFNVLQLREELQEHSQIYNQVRVKYKKGSWWLYNLSWAHSLAKDFLLQPVEKGQCISNSSWLLEYNLVY